MRPDLVLEYMWGSKKTVVENDYKSQGPLIREQEGLEKGSCDRGKEDKLNFLQSQISCGQGYTPK